MGFFGQKSWGTWCAFTKECCATCQFWSGEREFPQHSNPKHVRGESGTHLCTMGPSKTVGSSRCPYHPSRYKKWVNLP